MVDEFSTRDTRPHGVFSERADVSSGIGRGRRRARFAPVGRPGAWVANGTILFVYPQGGLIPMRSRRTLLVAALALLLGPAAALTQIGQQPGGEGPPGGAFQDGGLGRGGDGM